MLTVAVDQAAVEFKKERINVKYELKCDTAKHRWSVWKTHSQLKILNEEVRKLGGGGGAKFPGSGGLYRTNSRRSKIEIRMKKIEQYLRVLLSTGDENILRAVDKITHRDEQQVLLSKYTHHREPPSQMHKTVWMESKKGKKSSPNTGRGIIYSLPKARIRYDLLSGIAIFEITGEVGDTRSAARHKYLQLSNFHTWLCTWGDRIPGRESIYHYIKSLSEIKISRKKPPPTSTATWKAFPHFVTNQREGQQSRALLKNCKCTAKFTCTMSGFINIYETNLNYDIVVSPPTS